jgi:hypothetical protein
LVDGLFGLIGLFDDLIFVAADLDEWLPFWVADLPILLGLIWLIGCVVAFLGR